MIDKDVETATAMMADKSIVTGAQGAARSTTRGSAR